ncbi:uncharacterized protein [Argopecten irradians]|uniref:uncharacterized protein n=1 Tax=Argopecten irradians TaxID=31199 RepID=UPI003715521F
MKMLKDRRFSQFFEEGVLITFYLLMHSGNMAVSNIQGTIVPGQRLTGYVFRTFTIMGPKQCANECFYRPSCMSYNHQTDLRCELNRDSDTGQPGSLGQHTGYSYSNIDTWTGFSGNCTRGTCSAGQRCFEFTSTTSCIYVECMATNVFGVTITMEEIIVGDAFQAVCKSGYETRGAAANVSCMGNGQMAITSSYCHRTYSPGWILLGRFGRGNGENVYNTWTETGRDDNSNSNVPDECKEVNTSTSCTTHFRSGLIDDWASQNFTEAKFVLYVAGVEVVYITFNATNSDYMSWFAKERLISTSYTDLRTNSTSIFFSIPGSTAYRRFYIQKSYGGCGNDHGWIQVIDLKGNCFYDDADSFPQFFYAKDNVNGQGGYDYLNADVLAIYGKS